MAKSQTLTPEVHERLVAAMRAGNYVETAAAYAGVSKQSVYNWLRIGARGEDEPHPDPRTAACVAFAREARKAVAAAEIVDLARIDKAASKGAWQASAWRLERKFPEKWGRREKAVVQQEVRRELERMLAALREGLTAEEFDHVLTILVARDPGLARGGGAATPEGEAEDDDLAAGGVDPGELR